jgi:PTS system nitrogen regulatory IIA component
MKLSSLIKPELVLIKKSCKNHDELCDELIAAIYKSQKLPLPIAVVKKGIAERELLGGTVHSTGIAVPHARLENFDDFIIAIGILETPLEIAQPDRTVSIRMMMLLLTSHSSSLLYLNTLAAFAKISKETEYFTRLCNAANPSDFIDLLEEKNIEVTHELTIASVMHTFFITLHPENTVKDAVDILYKNHLNYIPILDKDSNFVGEVTARDIFAVGIPDYASKLGSLKFLNSFGPVEELLKNEHKILLKEIMKIPEIILEENSPVVEAMVKITQSNRSYLPVVKNKSVLKEKTQLAGIVGYMDILHKVLRA